MLFYLFNTTACPSHTGSFYTSLLIISFWISGFQCKYLRHTDTSSWHLHIHYHATSCNLMQPHAVPCSPMQSYAVLCIIHDWMSSLVTSIQALCSHMILANTMVYHEYHYASPRNYHAAIMQPRECHAVPLSSP